MNRRGRVNYSPWLYHWRLNEWLPFSGLLRSPARLNGYILLTPFPQFNHKHDLFCFSHCSGAGVEWSNKSSHRESRKHNTFTRWDFKVKQSTLKTWSGNYQTNKQKNTTGNMRGYKSWGSKTTAWRATKLPRALSPDKDLKALFLLEKKAEQMGITIFEEIESFSWPTSPTETRNYNPSIHVQLLNF